MIKLIKKELKLSAHPMCWMFACFPVMLLIPSYPYYICLFYVMFIDLFIFPLINENNDILYMSSLPITRKEMVKSKVLTFVVFQIFSMLVGVVFAILSNAIHGSTTQLVGFNANMSLFAFTIMSLGIHNLIVFPMYFKTAYRYILPVFSGIFVSSLFGLTFTMILNYIPEYAAIFDKWNNIPAQAILLVCSLIFYVLINILTIYLSNRRFEKVDL